VLENAYKRGSKGGWMHASRAACAATATVKFIEGAVVCTMLEICALND
jgi:hypothetical protein